MKIRVVIFLLSKISARKEHNNETGLMILWIIHSNLFADRFHQLGQKQGLIKGHNWTLSQSLLQAFPHMLGLVSQSDRVGVVERNLGLWVLVIDGCLRGHNF